MQSNFDATRLTVNAGGKEIILETGRLANQANGAVWIQCGGTVVLVTVVTQPLDRDISFFPLVVDYQEKMYAAGRVPGSFFRREMGRPSERETLCSRLIDRPIRPLFPKGFRDEVQVLATVLSADQENDPDVLAVTGASAALHLSQIPFNGPIAGARVAYVDGEFILNPVSSQIENATLNMVMAASEEAVVMVEGAADFIPHDVMSKAIEWGHAELQPLLQAQHQMREMAGKPKMEFVPHEDDADLVAAVEELATDDLLAAVTIPEKMARKDARSAVKKKVLAALEEDARFAEKPEILKAAPELLGGLEKKLVRKRIKDLGVRIDGRDVTTVRQIKADVGLLPRTHGSALFARGETKALCVATLGSGRDEQRVETLMGDENKRFMLHYNFPPYCVGEVKMVRVSRREIGHGNLAERAITPILPSAEDFPFTMRVVSEIMESNGSSSMATVCGASLALMDAGVPVSTAVAGIAMGLIKEGDEYYVLTDILGDEDALGDMDFKIAGSADGITAFQMDIKIAGIPPEVMARALTQAREARVHILGEMNKVLEQPRAELSDYAPQLAIVQVDPEVIRMIIGPGGKNIKQITADTGADVDIEDSGKVSIFAPTKEALEQARERVLYFDQKPEVGKIYEGPVKKILEIGAIVEILPGVEGLVHISQLALERVDKVTDVVKLGDTIKVKCLEVLDGGKMRLSRAAILAEEQGIEFKDNPPRRGGGGRGGDRRGDRGPRGGRGGDRGDRGGRGGDRGGRGGPRSND
ncbi:polyribonucleotide nucleotidyltransferase [Oceanidesulfovibrio marinus]|uniref:Polyribonucleotide nucleotidyltransferase n=1 Tax=Oceanidesulfovibrio marinus TaxID=370038 RepID=A0ABX6NLN8_9BACT|nr:polyribonucleotide nucleotidyltransferase [Oceanidesulfovibrio marinus]QJT10600.1 polyribonucleotide nucleotidyltransferase [Oceanidesulfovibrio marinus]